ncbi:hypothetical protein R1sor_007356 [Riccia sorocarpa]|uniref:Endonuclease/exonuclease/phosphatase domain-containing protein n=1 Tax=Riccia sorocarpa TaxID=122646 RepID=A0ABD3HQ84_9MARC
MLTVVQEVGLIKQAISTLHLDVHNLQLNLENQASEFGSQFNVLKEMVGVQSGTTDTSKLLEAVEEHFTTQMHQLREEQQSSGKMVVLLEEGLRQLQVQLSTQSVEIAGSTSNVRSRSLNLRIVGLPETPDENTRALVLDLFQDTLGVSDVGVDHVSRIGRSETNRTVLVLKGGSDTWESVDIIALVETWEWQGQNGLDIPGFSRVQTIFNSKRHSQGRGFGGIIIWARDGIGVNIQVELTDPDNQFICLRLSDEDPSFFIIAYFAPVGAPVYRKLGVGENPFLPLSQLITSLREQGPIWLLGDFNGRTGFSQAEKLPEVGSLPWSQLEELHDESRRSDDVVVNRMGEYFLQFASVCGLSVLNGTHQFPDTHGFTFTSPGGSSVIDYMLVSDTAWRRVSSFRLGPFVPESDHCPLFCEISGFRTRRRMRRVLVDRGWSTWNAASKTRYAELVNAKLQEDHSDNMVKISEFLVSMAGKVRHKSKDQPWFTSECSQARQKAISSPPEVKHEEFRAYKNLIKAKRREFVRKQQLLLAEELSREPRLFWTRLKTKQKGSELGDQELLGYVGRLYSFNDVEVMPYPEGPTCLFSVQEIPYALLLAETGRVPLEIEALFLTIQFAQRLKSQAGGAVFLSSMEDVSCQGMVFQPLPVVSIMGRAGNRMGLR